MAMLRFSNPSLGICEAFGFDPEKTRSITIEFERNDVVTAKAVVYVEEDEIKKTVEILKRCKLVPVEDVN